MNILDTILAAQNGDAVRQLGRQLGVGQDQAGSIVAALAPALAGGLQRNVQNPGGLDALMGALSGGAHAKYLDDPATLGSAVGDGNGILGHILGSKDVSRAVAARASQQTGLDTGLFKQALPLVAAMVMGAMSKQTAGGGQAAGEPAGGLLSMLTPLLDQNRDGSVVDDVLGMLGKLGR